MENDKITQNSTEEQIQMSGDSNDISLNPVESTDTDIEALAEAEKKDKDSDKSDKDDSDKNGEKTKEKSKKQDTKESNAARKELEKKTDSIMKEIGKLKPEYAPAVGIRDNAVAQLDDLKLCIKNMELNGDRIAE